MEPNRYVLKGSSLAKLGVQALADYGPEARIVSAERVTRGGIGGFMAREHFEVVVEVPPPRGQQSPALPPPPEADSRRRRRLREEAQERHSRGQQTQGQQAPGQQTPGQQTDPEDLDEDFARMMDDLWLASRNPAGSTETPAAELRKDAGPDSVIDSVAWSPVPAPAPPARVGDRTAAAPAPVPPDLLRAPGTLIVLACLGADESGALAVLSGESGLQAWGDPVLLTASEHADKPLREAKQVLREARARAVALQVPVLATCPVRFPRPGVRSGAESPAILEADQLWAVVDLRRKPEDIRHWLAALEESRAIDGLVLTCADETLSPESGHQLGWPVSVRMNQC
ncbi:hypothetical protein [Nesterenkonia sp. Act20]|uniref:hypothetical protein n=1 Tax=Nesterenkonia sp. Act20 TaxID=1483432 RepID=UPI001C474125|nr:hypothetical protein [Nesterenkonia sp. Act20]